MPELVIIPISFFEVAINYEKPEARLLGDRVPLVQAISDALLPYEFSLDDLEVLTAGKPSEQGVMFRLPQKHISFFVGPTLCRFSRNAVDWDLAEETISILDLVVSTLSALTGIRMNEKKTTIGMHLQPRTMPFRDVLRPFVPEQIAKLESAPITTMASVTRWAHRAITIDGSGSLANGVFVKLERAFAASHSYEEITQQLWKDEQELFAIMGVTEDRQ
jgi:hypothetical protein